ncbi:ComEC/Rec2 family competence protein [Clostridium perfringens]|uniref:MBL fold metallo-hydrolase n=1 Tax=Clostridium perfringens TaxID=1502 RepID=A0A8H9UVK0_CLOPF|nr:ComEC/Rec2 family competence protein [Clostridium perfringens]EHK2440766.1 MBL fold metallo-hydrolase [Clostridium perfringens]MCH1963127.1 MBL fold metallo-hydrolase [Clostridium perfringens]MDK0564529.1 ComEC/Rec2 family competence protein [Clostridium perfringens]MDK0570087.1 ComEC/Rec2 family competence protein [Clostridium perfringens]MDK0617389.1 ComEC/Rec2 family competence protein [Clostridium perfringens]
MFKKILAIISTVTVLSFAGCGAQKNNINKGSNNTEYSGMSVTYLNVGQGDSELIQVNGINMLIDAGTNAGANDLVKDLKNRGIKTIDIAIATHPHEDHIGGMDEVLESFDVKSFYAPKVAHTTKTYENMLKAVKNEGLKIKQIKEGTKIDLGKDTQVEVYSPVKSEYEELNNYSPVMKISYGQNSFMFTGDAETLVEKEILSENKNLKADVLKLGHHGSHSSTSEAFLKAVDPSIAIVSCAKDNKYGHPHKETMSNLKKAGVTVYETFRDGDITISSNGKKLDVKLHSENK